MESAARAVLEEFLTPRRLAPLRIRPASMSRSWSTSTNLVTSDPNGTSDAFLRNTCLGGSNCTPKTYLISAAAGGGSANGPSSEPSLDSTGLFAAFTSQGTNVASSVPLTGVTRQVFWRQICITTSGCNVYPFAPTLISISADGVSPGKVGDSYNPAISPDNRYVAFVSLATNLVSNASVNGIIPQVYLRDTCNGSVATGSGAMITLSGPAAATAVADSAGNYSFPGLANGTYTITPSNAGYSFAPPGQAVTIIGADISGVDFTGVTIPVNYSISGTISPCEWRRWSDADPERCSYWHNDGGCLGQLRFQRIVERHVHHHPKQDRVFLHARQHDDNHQQRQCYRDQLHHLHAGFQCFGYHHPRDRWI